MSRRFQSKHITLTRQKATHTKTNRFIFRCLYRTPPHFRTPTNTRKDGKFGTPTRRRIRRRDNGGLRMFLRRYLYPSFNEWRARDVHFCSLPTDFVELSVEEKAEEREAEVVLVCARIAASVMESRLFRLPCLRDATSFGQIGRGRIMPQLDFGTSGSRIRSLLLPVH